VVVRLNAKKLARKPYFILSFGSLRLNSISRVELNGLLACGLVELERLRRSFGDLAFVGIDQF